MIRIARIRRPSLAISLFLGLSAPVEGQYAKTQVGKFEWRQSDTGFRDVPGATLVFQPAAMSEVWIVLVSARLHSDSTAAAAAELRVQINNQVCALGGIQNEPANQGASFQSFCRVADTTNQQTVVVQIRDAIGVGVTSTVEDLQIIAFKLPDGADAQYAENLNSQAATGGIWSDYETLTFTPSSPGDYLNLAAASGSESPGTDGIGIRIEDPTAASWPVDDSGGRNGFFFNDSGAQWSFFTARVQTLSATPQTYRLQANGATGDSQINYTRILAFRTDVFESAETSEALAESATLSTSPVVKSSLTTRLRPIIGTPSSFKVSSSALLTRRFSGAADTRGTG